MHLKALVWQDARLRSQNGFFLLVWNKNKMGDNAIYPVIISCCHFQKTITSLLHVFTHETNFVIQCTGKQIKGGGGYLFCFFPKNKWSEILKVYQIIILNVSKPTSDTMWCYFFMSDPYAVMGQFYKGIIGKWPIYGHFPIIPLQFGKNIWEPQHECYISKPVL